MLQEKYAEAEPLLARGYEGMKQREAEIPAGSQVRLSETLEWLVQLYNGWGKNDQADAWRKRLEERKAASPGPANLRKSSATDPLLRVPPQRMGPR